MEAAPEITDDQVRKAVEVLITLPFGIPPIKTPQVKASAAAIAAYAQAKGIKADPLPADKSHSDLHPHLAAIVNGAKVEERIADVLPLALKLLAG